MKALAAIAAFSLCTLLLGLLVARWIPRDPSDDDKNSS